MPHDGWARLQEALADEAQRIAVMRQQIEDSEQETWASIARLLADERETDV